MDTIYWNISERWGDAVNVTVDDYREQAAFYGEDTRFDEVAGEGIFAIDGDGERELVAVPATE